MFWRILCVGSALLVAVGLPYSVESVDAAREITTTKHPTTAKGIAMRSARKKTGFGDVVITIVLLPFIFAIWAVNKIVDGITGSC